MYFIWIPLDCRRYKAILLVTFRTLSGNRRTIMETCTKLQVAYNRYNGEVNHSTLKLFS